VLAGLPLTLQFGTLRLELAAFLFQFCFQL